MEKAESQNLKKGIMLFALIFCIGILIFFKYFNFISISVSEIFRQFSIQLQPITLKLLMPIGISFYTFQLIGYIVDVYKGKTKAVQHFGLFATFISFFPQIMSGPIARTNDLIPQIEKQQSFDYVKITHGLKLIAWGFFKKIIVADTLAVYVNLVYANVHEYQGFSLVLVILFFSIQIYCDFSGYTDMAIGVAKLLGIDLMINFKSPYFSASIREFWSRWHISLSTWFRDYVYIPLGGSRNGRFNHYRNLLLTFLISGLWHGANWTYVIWGGVHGVAQIAEITLFNQHKRSEEKRLTKVVSVIGVFVFCSLAWVLFRATNIADAVYLFKSLFAGLTNPVAYIKAGFNNLSITKLVLSKLTILIIPIVIFDYLALSCDVISVISQLPLIRRWIIYISLLWIILLFMPSESGKEFIYFQF